VLLQFSVSNYRCFRELQTLKLAASSQDKTLPENLIAKDLPGLSGKQWLKGVAIYGANASGKSTIIEALKALATLVTKSASMTDPTDPIPQIEPFALAAEAADRPTAFAVALVAGGTRYEYRVAATRSRIWHESLRAFPGPKPQLWFSRDWNAKSSSYDWTPERPTGFERDRRLEGDTLANMLFLSKHVASNRTELDPVFRWFKSRITFLDLGLRNTIGLAFTQDQVERRTALYEPILELLRHADLGITGARVVESTPPPGLIDAFAQATPELKRQLRLHYQLTPELLHRGSGPRDVALPWISESAGTQRFFALAGPWLDILENGYTVFVDELETSMHPLMVRELLRLLFGAKSNPHGAQIVFTTHNPLLLDMTLMRRDQVWFTDKDSAGEGHLYPLTDYAPRNSESLVRGYMSGRYGGVPAFPVGLLARGTPYDVVNPGELEPDEESGPEESEAMPPTNP
jgi:uncharacterized protein